VNHILLPGGDGPVRSVHGPKPWPFILSLALHVALAGAGFQWDLTFSGESSRKPEYVLEIVNLRNEPLYYRPAPELPPIAPSPDIPTADVSRGEIASRKQSIVANPPGGRPGRQFIAQPGSARELERDVPAPNLVAVAPPERPRGLPREFVPPPERNDRLTSVPVVSLAPPPLAAAPGIPGDIRFDAPRVPPRPFVPPPDRPRRAPEVPLVPLPGMILAPATVEVPRLALGQGVSGIPAPPPPRPFVPPSAGAGGGGQGGGGRAAIVREAPPVIGGGEAAEGMNAIVAGLDPTSNLAAPIPEGSRSGQFSRGEQVGDPAIAAGGGGAALSGVPGLAVGPAGGAGAGKIERGSTSRPPAEDTDKWVTYETTVLKAARRTLSVPLRPSSRTIPPALEAVFRDRVVYTLVIPMDHVNTYTGDWILWFAERQSATSGTPQVYAPVPHQRKVAVDAGGPLRTPAEGRVRLAATILSDGRVDGVKVMRGGRPELDAQAVEDLLQWRFLAATRNGEPVDVDVVVDIPFSSVRQSAGR
jgi:TonB family protein